MKTILTALSLIFIGINFAPSESLAEGNWVRPYPPHIRHPHHSRGNRNFINGELIYSGQYIRCRVSCDEGLPGNGANSYRFLGYDSFGNFRYTPWVRDTSQFFCSPYQTYDVGSFFAGQFGIYDVTECHIAFNQN